MTDEPPNDNADLQAWLADHAARVFAASLVVHDVCREHSGLRLSEVRERITDEATLVWLDAALAVVAPDGKLYRTRRPGGESLPTVRPPGRGIGRISLSEK